MNRGADGGNDRPTEPARAAPKRDRVRRLLVAAGLCLTIVLVAIALGFLYSAQEKPPASSLSREGVPSAVYVRSAACARCHAKEDEAWRASQHARAMQKASGATILGDFDSASAGAGRSIAMFYTHDGRFYVRAEGPDGRQGEFEVKYTFGISPLQQYLAELPGGRLQALSWAWDARPKDAGGQRWFDLHAGSDVRAGSPMHWSGIDQNWNFQCADCHSTGLRKRFNEASGTFDTRWSEINVACEACHGPGSNHVAWAEKQDGWKRFDGPGKGLGAVLNERKGVAWVMDETSGNAVRSKPRDSHREIEVCARCHARRAQSSDDHGAGQPLHDAFRPALIEPDLYHPDGQQRDEVYTYGSFLQSRMHVRGVTCSDCHDPHSGRPRAPGNAVCAQCHRAEKYDAQDHHRHAPGSAGASCAACHMPATTYMMVDPRRDHGFRIPRPDRTVALATPNACNACHVRQSAQWAADALREWFPQAKPGFQAFAEAFHAADRGAPGATEMLIRAAADRTQSPFARASAVARLARYPSASAAAAIAAALDDVDANVRMAAVGALASFEPQVRQRLLPRMLGDTARVVRMDSARLLAGPAEALLPPEMRAKLERALGEYVAAQRFNAERPESHANLAGLHAARGEVDEAMSALRKALAIDATYAPAAAALADLLRDRGEEKQAEAVLRSLLASDRGSAPAHHALGLSLVRQKRMPEALAALREAASRAPENARFAYVYAVALRDSGSRGEALRILDAALGRHPYDRHIRFALASMEIAAGNPETASRHASVLEALEPGNPDVAGLAAQAREAAAKRAGAPARAAH